MSIEELRNYAAVEIMGWTKTICPHTDRVTWKTSAGRWVSGSELIAFAREKGWEG